MEIRNNAGNRLTGCGRQSGCSACGSCNNCRQEEKDTAHSPESDFGGCAELRERADFVEMFLSALEDFLHYRVMRDGRYALEMARREYGEDTRLLILTTPEDGYTIVPSQTCWSYLDMEYGDYTEFSETESIYNDMLIVSYNPDDLIRLGERRFLAGPMVISEMDEDGNECSIDENTVENFTDYIDDCLTYLDTEDGERYAVFRLD